MCQTKETPILEAVVWPTRRFHFTELLQREENAAPACKGVEPEVKTPEEISSPNDKSDGPGTD